MKYVQCYSYSLYEICPMIQLWIIWSASNVSATVYMKYVPCFSDSLYEVCSKDKREYVPSNKITEIHTSSKIASTSIFLSPPYLHNYENDRPEFCTPDIWSVYLTYIGFMYCLQKVHFAQKYTNIFLLLQNLYNFSPQADLKVQ